MKKLYTYQELIDRGYPFGMVVPGIPMGDEELEIHRTRPDIVLYNPAGSKSWANDNEHFLVFEAPSGKGLLAIWTQSSCEGHGDNHLVIARSDDGVTWSEPEYITGTKPGVANKQASWGFPVVSKQGRLYVFYTMEMEFFDNSRQGSGLLGCIYSDDDGVNWSSPEALDMPKSRYDNPDGRYPKNWIVWQIPIRDAKGRHIAGYTLVTSNALVKQHPMWVYTDSRSYFMRFENIDDNPEPGRIAITWLPDDDSGLEMGCDRFPDMSICQEPSLVMLPDGRLFVTMRTMTGYVGYSVSDDNGHSWRKPEILRHKDGGEGIKHSLSPCPVYKVEDGLYFLLVHNNDGNRMGFSQYKESWDFNESNFLRNPTYSCTGIYKKDAYQPIWFDEPEKLFDTDDIAVGPKQTAEVATYTSFTVWDGRNILWYPDRKFYLLGKFLRLTPGGKS